MMWAAVCAAIAACGGKHDTEGARENAAEAKQSRVVGSMASGAGSGSAPSMAMGSASAAFAPTPDQEMPKTVDTQARAAYVPPAPPRSAVSGAAARLAATMSVTQGHKLIRHGDLRVIVEGVDGARIKLEQLADDAGGFVDREEVDHADGHASRATLVLHVPADQFMTVMRGARALGAADRDETQTEDVTEEYTDVASRLANTKRLEQRLLQLVDTRAGSMADVLEVENQIADVRGTIEQMEGRMRVWDDQISMSRITVELALKATAPPPPPVAVKLAPLRHTKTWWDKTTAAARSSIGTLADGATAIAMGLAVVLPWSPFALVALLLLRLLGRRARRVLRARRVRADAANRADADLAARAAVAAAQAAGIAAAMEVAAAVD
jgi:hypothetical protein